MANLYEIRHKFVLQSGREDLASTVSQEHDKDEGADWYINNASRLLDTRQEQQKSQRLRTFTLAAGESQLDSKELRAAKRVWRGSSGGWIPLDKVDMDRMVEDYPDLENTTNGTPVQWCPYISTYAPAQLQSGQSVEYESVLILPPVDAVTTIRVYGLFHSLWLSSNGETNFWASRFPALLVTAALMLLEGSYRNMTGYRDWEYQVEKWLEGVDADIVEHSEGQSYMEG